MSTWRDLITFSSNIQQKTPLNRIFLPAHRRLRLFPFFLFSSKLVFFITHIILLLLQLISSLGFFMHVDFTQQLFCPNSCF